MNWQGLVIGAAFAFVAFVFYYIGEANGRSKEFQDGQRVYQESMKSAIEMNEKLREEIRVRDTDERDAADWWKSTGANGGNRE